MIVLKGPTHSLKRCKLNYAQNIKQKQKQTFVPKDMHCLYNKQKTEGGEEGRWGGGGVEGVKKAILLCEWTLEKSFQWYHISDITSLIEGLMVKFQNANWLTN